MICDFVLLGQKMVYVVQATDVCANLVHALISLIQPPSLWWLYQLILCAFSDFDITHNTQFAR